FVFSILNDPPTSELSTLSLHDALPICRHGDDRGRLLLPTRLWLRGPGRSGDVGGELHPGRWQVPQPVLDPVRRLDGAGDRARGGRGQGRLAGPLSSHAGPAAVRARSLLPVVVGRHPGELRAGRYDRVLVLADGAAGAGGDRRAVAGADVRADGRLRSAATSAIRVGHRYGHLQPAAFGTSPR